MELTKELFAIPTANDTILYAPLEGSLLRVNGGVVNFLQQVKSGENPRELNPDLTEKLLSSRILRETQAIQPAVTRPSCETSEYSPTSVTLLPTYNCNLRCVYCYARAGEDKGKVMTPEIAKASLDLIVGNALAQGKKSVSCGFHGGGEPLMRQNMKLVNYAIDYLKNQAEKNQLKYRTSVVSNGVHSLDTMEWAVKNMDHINISLDGPKDIQDAQRPKFAKEGNQGSFEDVARTVGYLEKAVGKDGKKFSYGIRATITAESVTRMPEILEFFHSISTNQSFHLEPLFECGRCFVSKSRSPDPQVFLEQLLLTEKKAKELGVSVYYSGGSLDKLGETFCGACGNNFFVTPNGFVTTCLEACREEDAISNAFFIGKYNPQTKGFDFDDSKIQNLRKRKVENMPFCQDCFAKYNCSGDCPAKVYEQTGDLLDPSKNWRCDINRGLLLERMVESLDKSKLPSSKITA